MISLLYRRSLVPALNSAEGKVGQGQSTLSLKKSQTCLTFTQEIWPERGSGLAFSKAAEIKHHLPATCIEYIVFQRPYNFK